MIALTAYGFGALNKENVLIAVPVQTANYVTAPNKFVPVDATSGSVIVTLPAVPSDLTRAGLKLVRTASGHTATLLCGGSDVFNDDGTTSIVLSLVNQGVIAQYSAADAAWYVQADDLPLPALDGRYAELAGAVFTGAATGGVAAFTYASTIPVNAALGDHFRVTLLGNATISSPTGAADGQKITFEIVQDGTGGRMVTWGALFDFGSSDLPVLTPTPFKRDLIGFVYSADLGKWMFAGQTRSF